MISISAVAAIAWRRAAAPSRRGRRRRARPGAPDRSRPAARCGGSIRNRQGHGRARRWYRRVARRGRGRAPRRPRSISGRPVIGWPRRAITTNGSCKSSIVSICVGGSARRWATATSIAPRSSCSAASMPVSGSQAQCRLGGLARRRLSARRPTSATSAYSAMPAVKIRALFAGSKPTPRLSAGLDMLDRRRDQRRNLARAGGRLHADPGAHEQIVGEQARADETARGSSPAVTGRCGRRRG